MVNESFKKLFYDLMSSIFDISGLIDNNRCEEALNILKKLTLRKTNILIVSYLKFA